VPAARDHTSSSELEGSTLTLGARELSALLAEDETMEGMLSLPLPQILTAPRHDCQHQATTRLFHVRLDPSARARALQSSTMSKTVSARSLRAASRAAWSWEHHAWKSCRMLASVSIQAAKSMKQAVCK